jgi:hypothetical protein
MMWSQSLRDYVGAARRDELRARLRAVEAQVGAAADRAEAIVETIADLRRVATDGTEAQRDAATDLLLTTRDDLDAVQGKLNKLRREQVEIRGLLHAIEVVGRAIE